MASKNMKRIVSSVFVAAAAVTMTTQQAGAEPAASSSLPIARELHDLVSSVDSSSSIVSPVLPPLLPPVQPAHPAEPARPSAQPPAQGETPFIPAQPGLPNHPSPQPAAGQPSAPGSTISQIGGLEPINVPDPSAPMHYVLNADGSSGEQLPGEKLINWDVAVKTVRAYMNAGHDGIANKESSRYIDDVTSVIASTFPEIDAMCQQHGDGMKPAVVFDTDDTTLWTYDMEDSFMHFAFTPEKQDEYFSQHQLPATPGMVEAVKRLHDEGCEIIGLTGRNRGQKEVSLDNLKQVGYVDDKGEALFTPDLFFTKFRNDEEFDPFLSDANGGYCPADTKKCTTVQYKAGVRRHLTEDLGYNIVGTVGDQWSDLMGGMTGVWVKLPNPTYYLPSENLPSTAESDAAAGMQPATLEYAVAADGSTGSREGVSAKEIPNLDVVKSTIRHYYGATKNAEGVYEADLVHSPYARELARDTERWVSELRQTCSAAVAVGKKPAAVFDTDDTVLSTYGMEEAIDFNFNVDRARDYLKTNYHSLPATPGMAKVVEAATDAGCTVIGLTGRADEFREVSLRNLKEAGYAVFTPDRYITKPGSTPDAMPDWIRCAGEKCTTVEFKAGTRRHLQEDQGYTIVANFGDQWSDLAGGYSQRSYKLPNITYYLP